MNTIIDIKTWNNLKKLSSLIITNQNIDNNNNFGNITKTNIFGTVLVEVFVYVMYFHLVEFGYQLRILELFCPFVMDEQQDTYHWLLKDDNIELLCTTIY